MAKGHPEFEALVNGEGGTLPLVLPIIGCFAARVSQLSLDAMWGDSMNLARCLEDVQGLTGAHALCGAFDLTLLTEALGFPPHEASSVVSPLTEIETSDLLPVGPADLLARGRLPVLLDAWDRLKITVNGVSRVGVVPGIATTTAYLLRAGVPWEKAVSSSGMAARTLARALLERGVHHVLLAEQAMSSEDLKCVKEGYQSISNLVHFFRGKLFLLTSKAPLGVGDRLQVDVYLGAAVQQAGNRLCGGGIPTAALAQGRVPREEAIAWLAGPGRRFLATDWEVPFDTPPDIMLNIGQIAKQ